jgi:histidinol-phosphatase (PHP family)
VLSELHVHLRLDEPSTIASEYFTRENATRFREAAAARGIELLGVAEHVFRFAQSLDVWDHPFWRRWAIDDLDAYCAFVREETDLKLGLEADFVAGREEQLGTLLQARDWDYVLGSVHFISDYLVDSPEYDIWADHDAETVWRRYFQTLGDAARSGLFDILSHPDLVKVWGKNRPRPDGDLRRFYALAMEGIEQSDVAIEVSTAGLGTPAGEIYPAPEFLEMCLEVGRPVALSSDAHVPERLGYKFDEALEFLRSMGVTEIADFSRRERRMVPLG